jgi:hypothetical protein
MYAWGRTVMPGRNLGFWTAALLGCVMPEICHRMLSDQDFRPHKKQQSEHAQ